MSGKTIGHTVSEARETLRPMALRNLRIALALRPKLIDLKEKLGYTPQMLPQQYSAWKTAKADKIQEGMLQLLKDHNIPIYQVPVIRWLFEAEESEVTELRTYCRKPTGIPPRTYYLLYSPAYQFESPTGLTWSGETGYRVALLTKEGAGYWQIWGDLRELPDKSWWAFMSKSGDFVVRGNLEVFDIDSWRRVGKLLSTVKKQTQMGKKLGLVVGGQKGRPKARKSILRGMTWVDIQNIVAQDPKQYNPLCHEYTRVKRQDFEEKYREKHDEPLPPGPQLRKAQKKALKNFAMHVKRVR